MQIQGPRTWGLVMLTTCIAAAYAIVLDGRTKGSLTAARLAFVLHGTICGTFGLSIFVLTLNGTVSAISGATKWWMFFAVAARFLRYRQLTEPEQEKPG